ncbi:MAG TPA: hypothetical protein VE978_18025 [Chitinophagales bacterium]|nr:hypothetical protein [Chitinophagales bacterium]
MRYILTILFFSLLTAITFAKGGSGIYYIKGTAYGADKAILKNAELTVKVGGRIKTIRTDDHGQFEIEVQWESACPSGRTILQHRCDNKKINPEFIYIRYDDKEVKVNNKWKKYGQLFPESEDKIIRKKDLYFN